MKELEKEYSKKNGFHQVQVGVSDHAYIYEMIAYGVHYFNVFLRKENKKYDTVKFPKPESFGKWAWCYMTMKDALKKFNDINESSHDK